jgi:uncharacterized protein YnzC (UPF0291/DUF896 family)
MIKFTKILRESRKYLAPLTAKEKHEQSVYSRGYDKGWADGVKHAIKTRKAAKKK